MDSLEAPQEHKHAAKQRCATQPHVRLRREPQPCHAPLPRRAPFAAAVGAAFAAAAAADIAAAFAARRVAERFAAANIVAYKHNHDTRAGWGNIRGRDNDRALAGTRKW